MKVLVFGSRNLTARHLPAMRRFIAAEGLYKYQYIPTKDDTGEGAWDERPMPLPLDLIMRARDSRDIQSLLPDDASLHGSLVLIHGDGPPGKAPGALGADKLAEIAASLEWPDTRRCRRFPPEQAEGESWGQAAARRNAAMVARRPDRALCFHTDLDRSRGSSMTAEFLKKAGLGFRYVRLSGAGEVLTVEER